MKPQQNMFGVAFAREERKRFKNADANVIPYDLNVLIHNVSTGISRLTKLCLYPNSIHFELFASIDLQSTINDIELLFETRVGEHRPKFV